MAEIVLSLIVEALVNKLGSSALNEIAAAWRFKESLDKLSNTINTIKDMLSDAEERQIDSQAIRGWLERLLAVVYTADDLFDKSLTMALMEEGTDGNKPANEVRRFFSHSNQISFAWGVARNIKKIREELDDIEKDANRFAFRLQPYGDRETVHKRRDQTYSFVDADNFIGRDDDKKSILKILLNSTTASEKCGLFVVPIIGIGGMGKTSLAQVIYNDVRVKKHFELRLWICVSEDSDIEVLIRKILMSATNTEPQKLEIEQLQAQMREQVSGKKYLLVLDDVWNESRQKWLELSSLLNCGKEGSRILVTTRSKEVAKIMGVKDPYVLQGLLKEEAWDLFKKMAFETGQAEQKPHLVEIGKEIVKKCSNVPLVIRTVGSLLYGQDQSKWLLFKDRSLANISNSEDSVMEILKLSYHHLCSPLKNCFTYCSLYPKDYVFKKEELVNLWMAEGFILSENNGQGLEELAEDYFRIMLQRCFFQDVKEDEWGNIVSCKMHDLMHDLAQQVAGVNYKVAKLEESSSNMGNYHLSFAYCLTSEWKIPSWMQNLKLLRTFLLPEQMKDGTPFSKSICQELISGFGCLRVLDLHKLGIRNLPNSIGNLIHLRYLNLSDTPLRELPNSITKLHNLQTLNLYRCLNLRKLPKNIGLLKNIRSLDVGECIFLFHMPSGLGNLTSLNKLPQFIVVYRNCPESKYKPNTAKLSDLKNLNNLKGALHIQLFGEVKNPLLESTEANLDGKDGLTKFHLELNSWLSDDVSGSNHDESILEGLKPPPNLKVLEIQSRRVQKLPSWAIMDNLCKNLENLVEIKLDDFRKCQQVPCFSKLLSLKRLSLISLKSVEYMESSPNDLLLSSKSPMMSTQFFPSLEELTLMYMHNLKGWWKEAGETTNHGTKDSSQRKEQQQQHLLSMSFFNLSKLSIQGCPKLISMPLCPNVKELSIRDANENISVSKMVAASPSTSTLGSVSKLKKLSISNVEDLKSLPTESLQQLSSLQIWDMNLVSTAEIGEKVFKSISSSLVKLEFCQCHSLRFFSQGLEHLTAIQTLVFNQTPLTDENLEWKYLKSLRSLHFRMIRPELLVLPSGLRHLTNLRSLQLTYNDELREIPEWISCFTSLRYMQLYDCPKLTSLPEAFRKLTALNQLDIMGCPGLTERCRRPNGSEWPKIQHIPLVTVFRNILEG